MEVVQKKGDAGCGQKKSLISKISGSVHFMVDKKGVPKFKVKVSPAAFSFTCFFNL